MTPRNWYVAHDPPGSNHFERWDGLTFAQAIDYYDTFVADGCENVRMAYTSHDGKPVIVNFEAYRAA